MYDDKKYQESKKMVKRKRGFYRHLGIYIIVNGFIILSNFIQHPFSFDFGPALPWGLGLAIHYFTVFGFPGSRVLTAEWEEKEIEKEVKRLENTHDTWLPKRPAEEQMELNDLNKKWSEKDLV